MMLRGFALILALCVSAPAFAQEPPEMDLFSDAPFVVPDAPEVEIPGGPAPEPLCTLADTYDFNASDFNPGLLTAAQYRRWTVQGFDRSNPRDLMLRGLMHEYGHHLVKDDLRAKRYYEQAADMEYLPAIERLATIACSKGLYCTSARGFFKASNRGSKVARLGLSKHYRWGKGVFYDPIAAYHWAWVGMEKTKGNWLVVDPQGESYLRGLETYMSDNDLQAAETKINAWKNGFDNSRLMCKQD